MNLKNFILFNIISTMDFQPIKFCQQCGNMLYLKINNVEKNQDTDDEDGKAETSSCTLNHICRKCNQEYDSNKEDKY